MTTQINVETIPNIKYIGDIIHKDTKSKGKWKVEYKCDKETQKQENGRIYFLVINSEIYKIGSSSCEGGIKTTFAFYEGGLGGSPSIRTFGIHLLIQNSLMDWCLSFPTLLLKENLLRLWRLTAFVSL
jgi:hypothetical protein